MTPFGDGSPIITPEIYIPEGAVFNPTSLITGAGGFWRADTGVTLSGSNVTAWADQSSFANNLSCASAFPTFSSTGFNSAKSGIIYTSASGNGLTNTGVTFAAGTTLTAFILLQKGTGAAGFLRYLALQTAANNDFTTPSIEMDEANGAGDQIEIGSSGVQGNGGSPFNLTSNSLYLLGAVFDGAHANMWVNGAVQGTGSVFTANLGGAGSNTLACGPVAGQAPAGMKVAFWGITQKAMNSTDWTNLKNWSNTNWGTSF